ncbi:hypothetical protein LEP1GSC062_1567 [Leptospira alexanderi serovar Manhao 3 str. L 60]|uniref:Uncharacterized protein n=1 Tax=Leptospira alexanderi serovar Manhao 3 str. L 60 TaxID=1049759 RepID=V6HUN8_9LEPT|nr:hypothetical protein LEP1GSC062_1567 [Leptospira alexanderi serovar Manhao 3 str. L 60]
MVFNLEIPLRVPVAARISIVRSDFISGSSPKLSKGNEKFRYFMMDLFCNKGGCLVLEL